MPTLRREFGGCAGNIAYNLARARRRAAGAGGASAATARDYLARLRSWGTTTELVRAVADSYTAQAIIITDPDNNQITAFHPGAMQSAHLTAVPAGADIQHRASSRPTAATRCCSTPRQLAAAGIPFIFDPGQGLPMFDGAELQRLRRAGDAGSRSTTTRRRCCANAPGARSRRCRART